MTPTKAITLMETPDKTPPSVPAWKNAKLVLAYGVVLALIPTLVTGVAGLLESHRQLELAARQHAHERTFSYLQLAIDPKSTEGTRAMVLRFLVNHGPDPVDDWATDELHRVESAIAELQTRANQLQGELAEIESSGGDNDDSRAPAQRIRTRAAAIRAELHRVRRRVNED